MKFIDRLFEIFVIPEEILLLKDRIRALETRNQEYHVREPKVFIVADEQDKMGLK